MVGLEGELPGGVRGCKGSHQERDDERTPRILVWRIERGSRWNFRRLGRRLSRHEDLFRDGSRGLGLIQVLDDGKTRRITRAAELAPLIADRIPMRVEKDGKVKSEMPGRRDPERRPPERGLPGLFPAD